jgi:nucleoside-diphosphate-sugar epimerase
VADQPATRPLGPLGLPELTLVTGAAGWLGRGLLHHLTDPSSAYHRSGRVRALVLNAEEQTLVSAISPVIEVVVGDVTEPSKLDALFDGASDGADLIHTAGVIHPTSMAQFDQVNAAGTRNVVAAARRSGIRRMVHVSSNSPFGTNPDPGESFRANEPYNPYLGYGRSKMDGELAVLEATRADRLDAVIVRPPWFYGPWQPLRQTTFFQMVAKGRFPLFGGGRQRRSMVYIDNLVQGVVRAELSVGEPGRAWWIADARPYEVREIVSTVQQALRAEGLESKDGGLRAPQLVASFAVTADKTLQKLGKYVQEVHVLGEMGATIACEITAARNDLGYEPEIDLLEGMRRSIRWCREQGVEL